MFRKFFIQDSAESENLEFWSFKLCVCEHFLCVRNYFGRVVQIAKIFLKILIFLKCKTPANNRKMPSSWIDKVKRRF